MTDAFDYDLFVIGGGSGGVRAARIAALTGAKVALAEEYRMGGTCVIRGCVPKKLMVYASSFGDHFEDAAGYGWSVGDVSFDWTKLKAARDAEVTRLEGIYQRNLANAGVEVFEERAVLAGTHEVELASGKRIAARHILIATGGRPFVPELPGGELVIDSNGVFDLEEQPKRVAVIGGGYIACEFACVFKGLGSVTHLHYRGEQILRGFDDDVRDHVCAEMRARGVDIHLGAVAQRLEQVDGGIRLHLTDGAEFTVDTVLSATGRLPNTVGLGLEAVGVALKSNGAIEVDAWSQTSVPSIYAVGDVTDRIALTPVAIREGHAFADTVFGNKPWTADHTSVASAVFTQPEIGTVGLTETQARARYDVEIYQSSFRPMNHILAGREEKMLMKLIVDKASRKVLGVHIVGHGAGEMIQMAGIAVKMGATKEDFDATVAVHPTAAEELVTMREPLKTG